MKTVLALSPHLDDAAFSAGATLATLARSGWRAVMATLFTATVPDPQGFALACQLDKGLDGSVDYMALRRAEDAAAAACLGVEALHLPFREAPHRGYGSAGELFAATRTDDAVVADLAPALAALVGSVKPDLILAPQAVGGHVDHVQTVRALRKAAPRAAVLWWRDFPYTVREARPKEPLADLFAALPQRAFALGAAAWDAKAAACAAYTTQIGFQFGGEGPLRERLAREAGREAFRASAGLPDALLADLPRASPPVDAAGAPA